MSYSRWLILTLTLALLLLASFELSFPGKTVAQGVLGISIFFLFGFNVAIFLVHAMKLPVTRLELLSLSCLLSFFLLPAGLYACYLIFGKFDEQSIRLLVTLVTTGVVLLSYFFTKKVHAKIY